MILGGSPRRITCGQNPQLKIVVRPIDRLEAEPEGLTLRVYNASHFIVLRGRLWLISSHQRLFYGLTGADDFDGEAIGVGGLKREFPSAPSNFHFFPGVKDNPTECSGPPHLLGPWGSAGRSVVEWPPR